MRRTTYPAGLLALALAFTLAACDAAGPAPSSNTLASEAAAHGTHGDRPSSAVNRDLAALRQLLGPLHNFERAKAAGWDIPITDCIAHPTAGGMGIHYENGAYLADGGAVAVTEPERLVWEPQKNGRMRLVAVEYIVPFTDIGPDEDPPVLFGREFHAVEHLGLWALHAWVGRHNPSGMFADFNPNVSCEHA